MTDPDMRELFPSSVTAHLARYGKVVLTVYCGSCKAERHTEPSRIGDVVEAPTGVRMWITTDRRRNPGLRLPNIQVLYTPARSVQLVPESLTAYCHHHGRGSVSTSDVLNKRGSVVLNLNATA